ncbi:hypothetical protein COU01_01250 [Candidatus Falkowbacteria bacterium CG10_big_fil_rev_8_21_14_0_10_44_15]|uniref:Uncharacterized protein n=1 Tax=Candidatus Falkowbacteria bacterium CG10_big_fil_rev_8_21_14_0_10_44_15 TaxID=1974569 RepID=A0A2H0V0B5_9BACT|nr:MAG: hypothetical protein COU01_01250 [Candidatus Falkowbacteria bacterium CG10_big_fil_rev_8_21_14_0_10_44_15]
MPDQKEGPSTLEELVRKNLELTQELQKQMGSVRRYLFWQRLTSIFYLIIIVGPIIIGIIYLPPLLKNVIAPYQELLGGDKSGGLDINSILNGLNR